MQRQLTEAVAAIQLLGSRVEMLEADRLERERRQCAHASTTTTPVRTSGLDIRSLTKPKTFASVRGEWPDWATHAHTHTPPPPPPPPPPQPTPPRPTPPHPKPPHHPSFRSYMGAVNVLGSALSGMAEASTAPITL